MDAHRNETRGWPPPWLVVVMRWVLLAQLLAIGALAAGARPW